MCFKAIVDRLSRIAGRVILKSCAHCQEGRLGFWMKSFRVCWIAVLHILIFVPVDAVAGQIIFSSGFMSQDEAVFSRI